RAVGVADVQCDRVVNGDERPEVGDAAAGTAGRVAGDGAVLDCHDTRGCEDCPAGAVQADRGIPRQFGAGDCQAAAIVKDTAATLSESSPAGDVVTDRGSAAQDHDSCGRVPQAAPFTAGRVAHDQP